MPVDPPTLDCDIVPIFGQADHLLIPLLSPWNRRCEIHIGHPSDTNRQKEYDKVFHIPSQQLFKRILHPAIPYFA
jgi:hypothetical protein